MDQLDLSYRACYDISRRSRSNFYRSFSLLSFQRRRAMYALYAFARLADDWSDDAENGSSTQPADTPCTKIGDWRTWVSELYSDPNSSTTINITTLDPIRCALVDAIKRFHIPRSALDRLLDGIEFDGRSPVRMESWSSLVQYCQSVASSVGQGCLAIWLDRFDETVPAEAKAAADACGIAFQLTNILRDVTEDSLRDRCYLASDDLARFGLTSEDWIAECRRRASEALQYEESSEPNLRDPFRALIEVYLERTSGYYDIAWSLIPYLSLEGRRMFSLMWSTYHAILSRIRSKPCLVFEGRVRVSAFHKFTLLAKHLSTPLYQQHVRRISARQRLSLEAFVHSIPLHGSLPTDGSSCNSPSLIGSRVAIVGGGLAGCNSALHLARQGAKVSLFESRMRLGGRVGSFVDKGSGLQIDYCQHVGMKCCKELRRWIELTHQQDAWGEQAELHFVSNRGRPLTVRAWPLPAPFHLSGLLLKWPDLRFRDRIVIGWGLCKLLFRAHDKRADQELALPWLISTGQTERSLKNFWETILVSALGEKIERVSLGATRKVLIDGFAATRDAFHLLVPKLPLSELVDEQMRSELCRAGVRIHDQTSVQRLDRNSEGSWLMGCKEPIEDVFDCVVIAVPWHRVEPLLAGVVEPTLAGEAVAKETLSAIESSPITGVHTWWDKPWLNSPHAILINRTCQWVFPGPDDSVRRGGEEQKVGPNALAEAYYQVVISASHDLPRGDSSQVLDVVQQELQSLFPEARKSRLLRGKVVTDPNAVFSVSPAISGARWSASRFAKQGIFFAGDWTETGWPATMEGALRSGVQAAEALAIHRGTPMKILVD
jgi:squalene-associated FAD-dependent desaturase